jgi:hypothetical protein
VWLLRRADGLSLGIEEDRAAAAAMGFVDDSKGKDSSSEPHVPYSSLIQFGMYV